ncbi:hypothetical protein [Paenibacillus spongiae]|uniref:Uncharacterized protein n=1 Tax=Paenibacillus spongiae TaxID=2909671 RepID=A0ABY5SFF4_9BACL|nr:hypothetical protein [Paenibacillus spongiae]UVI32702.1 hypothetical protein L1F29_13120 [Paenibacillus spongiae]
MTDMHKISGSGERPVHDYYRHAGKAYALLPGTIDRLRELKEALGQADEDFLAIELRTMLERLEEIRELMEEGPQG